MIKRIVAVSALVGGVIALVPAVAASADPAPAPIITAPAGPVTGTVTLAATTAAMPGTGSVAFLVNGTVVGNAEVTAGATAADPNRASFAWTTWGRANGAVTLTAENCDLNNVCGEASDPVDLDVENGRPQITHPTANASLRGGFTLSAAAPSAFTGALRFLVDGHAYKDFTAAPYSTIYNRSLAKGWHTFTVTECNKAKTVCGGPQASTRFYADSLHPLLSWISPSVFSPNGDRVRDTTKIAFSLPDTERVVVRIFHGSTQVWAKSYTSLARGAHTLTWNGYNGRTRMHDGTYTVRVDSSAKINGVTVTGASNARTVRVDDTAPGMSSITGNHAGFYPYRDGYRDTFAPAFTLNEAGWVTLTVRDTHGHTLRVLRGYRHAGRTSIGWSGYTASGHRFAGTFYWYLTSQDSVGNRRTIGHYVGYASTKRLVGHTATYAKAGAGDFYAGGSADYCSGASKSASNFPTGIWLLNVCDPDPYFGDGFQVAASFYHFTLPHAVKYGSMSTSVVGYTINPPSEIYSGFRKSDGSYDGGKTASVYSTNPNGTTYHLGSAAVAGHSTPITVGIALDDAYNSGGDASDFDLKSVQLTVHYYTLG